MNDQKFIDRIQEKIENLTGRDIELRIDDDNGGQLQVDFARPVPLVVMGCNILEYSGFVCPALHRVRRRVHPRTARDSRNRVPDAAGPELDAKAQRRRDIWYGFPTQAQH